MLSQVMQNDVRRDIKESVQQGRYRLADILSHITIGLIEEVGEVAQLVRGRVYRPDRLRQDNPEAWSEEIGDVLWYVLALMVVLDLNVDDVWLLNREKLEDRYEGAEQRVSECESV